MTREPMTLRKLIAKLAANDKDHGDAFMDLPLKIRVFDGYRHSTVAEIAEDTWPWRHYGHGGALEYPGEIRFDAPTNDYRLVSTKRRK